MKTRLAKITSNVLNPFLVSLGIIAIVSFRASDNTADAIKWSLIAVGVAIVPVLVVIIYMLHSEKIQDFYLNIRQQRYIIYFLECGCMIAGCAIFFFLGAPKIIIATFFSALSSMILFMLINFVWKISVHTAFVAGSVTILMVLFGFIGAISLALLPAMVWARTELKRHSRAQAIAGAVISPAVVLVVFTLFGVTL